MTTPITTGLRETSKRLFGGGRPFWGGCVSRKTICACALALILTLAGCANSEIQETIEDNGGQLGNNPQDDPTQNNNS